MNDLQLYDYYLTLPKNNIQFRGKIYPKYCVIIGRAICSPHPHRHFTLNEFIDKLEEDSNFRKMLEKK